MLGFVVDWYEEQDYERGGTDEQSRADGLDPQGEGISRFRFVREVLVVMVGTVPGFVCLSGVLEGRVFVMGVTTVVVAVTMRGGGEGDETYGENK